MIAKPKLTPAFRKRRGEAEKGREGEVVDLRLRE
jgi:hypothetical protein